MTGVLVVVATLAILALLAFAVSVIAFLVQTSRHRSSGRWAAAAGASLALVLVFGGIANAVRGEGGPSIAEEQASVPNPNRSMNRPARRTAVAKQIATWIALASKLTKRHNGSWSKTRAIRTT